MATAVEDGGSITDMCGNGDLPLW